MRALLFHQLKAVPGSPAGRVPGLHKAVHPVHMWVVVPVPLEHTPAAEAVAAVAAVVVGRRRLHTQDGSI